MLFPRKTGRSGVASGGSSRGVRGQGGTTVRSPYGRQPGGVHIVLGRGREAEDLCPEVKEERAGEL